LKEEYQEEYMKQKDQNRKEHQVYHMNTKGNNNFSNQKNCTPACAQGQNKTTCMLCNCKLTSHATNDCMWLGQCKGTVSPEASDLSELAVRQESLYLKTPDRKSKMN
jgi:hypothetical protein